jgi:hypothetical protein
MARLCPHREVCCVDNFAYILPFPAVFCLGENKIIWNPTKVT